MYKDLIGQTVTLFCANYIYTGKLVEVSDDSLKLESPAIVYDTGPFDNSEWADVQPLPKKAWYVSKAAVESFGICK